MVKVAVITPSFNQGKFIERTIKSVLLQNADEFDIEHLIFDAGSSDETLNILESYHNKIRWIVERDRGQAHAVNKGLSSSSAEIFGWLNSDDIYYPNAIKHVVEFFFDHPEVDVVYGLADHIDIHDTIINEYPTEPYDFERLKDVCIICQPALFFRRRVVEHFGLLNEALHYCMDYEYWLRLGLGGAKFAFLSKKLACSRMYKDNKTLNAPTKVHREINNMFKHLFGYVPDRWLANFSHKYVESKIKKERYPRSFIFFLIIILIVASFYWNKSISTNSLEMIRKWASMIKR